MAGMADEVAVRAEAQRLDHLRVLATEDRIEAEVMLGQHGQLISELEGLVVGKGLTQVGKQENGPEKTVKRPLLNLRAGFPA